MDNSKIINLTDKIKENEAKKEMDALKQQQVENQQKCDSIAKDILKLREANAKVENLLMIWKKALHKLINEEETVRKNFPGSFEDALADYIENLKKGIGELSESLQKNKEKIKELENDYFNV